MPRYKKNFITEAIIKIDFSQPILSLSNSISEDLDRFILGFFSQKETKNSFSEELTLIPNSDVVERKKSEFKEWNYFANEKNKRLCITKDFIYVSYKQYISYEDFTENFLKILSLFSKVYSEFLCRRIGIRYVNNIRISEPNPTDWSQFINDHMTCLVSLKPEDSELTRVFQILELINGDIRTKFQFGMHNPDFPSIIKKKEFILDMDSSKVGSINFDELESLIPDIHNIIEDLFEKSIKQPLKDLMNE